MSNQILATSYDTWLVAASFLVSAFGAYAALAATALARTPNGSVNKSNILAAGLALGGVGIWSMHFLGMLALKADAALGYQLTATLVSLIAAVAVSALALGFVASGPFSYKRLAIAGPVAGIGVSIMHFLGMWSMKFGGFLDWNVGTVAVAVLIAMVAATAALWLAFHVRSTKARAGASLVMAAAVCTMHYTGMAAASLVCTSADPMTRIAGLLYRSDMQLLVFVIAVGAAGIVGLDTLVQRMNLVSTSPRKA